MARSPPDPVAHDFQGRRVDTPGVDFLFITADVAAAVILFMDRGEQLPGGWCLRRRSRASTNGRPMVVWCLQRQAGRTPIAIANGESMINRAVDHRLCRELVRASTICSLVAFVGCGTHQRYPQMWPAPEHSQNCEELAGNYRNEGATATSLPSSLTELLFESGGFRGDEVSVDLSFATDRQLRIDVAVGAAQLPSLVLPSKQVTCRKGALIVRSGAHWVGGVSQLGFGIGKTSTAIELRRAGSYLIVKRKATMRGVYVAIPVVLKDETWHRFERLASDRP